VPASGTVVGSVERRTIPLGRSPGASDSGVGVITTINAADRSESWTDPDSMRSTTTTRSDSTDGTAAPKCQANWSAPPSFAGSSLVAPSGIYMPTLPLFGPGERLISGS
jgi:hypothetical protein